MPGFESLRREVVEYRQVIVFNHDVTVSLLCFDTDLILRLHVFLTTCSNTKDNLLCSDLHIYHNESAFF